MEFDEYQEKALSTAIYPNIGENICYPTLGLNGEAGEIAEIVKKVYRDHKGIITLEDNIKLRKELGDLLWYVAITAHELSISLNEIALQNLAKLSSRKERDRIHGNGSDR